MKNHLLFTGITLLLAIFLTSCGLEDRENIVTPGAGDDGGNNLSLTDNISPVQPAGPIEVILSPTTGDEIWAEVTIAFEGNFVKVVGEAKVLNPGEIYQSFFYDTQECAGQNRIPPVLIGKWEVDSDGFGRLNGTVEAPTWIQEQFRSISLRQITADNPDPGKLKACGVFE